MVNQIDNNTDNPKRILYGIEMAQLHIKVIPIDISCLELTLIIITSKYGQSDLLDMNK